MDFVPFPKIARFSREVIVTEKIDGTNAQVHIADDGTITAGSRSRWITPEDDNHGFARWVAEHADDLRKLGPGSHFGEWWGAGVQRRYDLKEKRFSLFNVGRWGDEREAKCPKCFLSRFETWAPAACERCGTERPPEPVRRPACCHVVPTLWRGTMDVCDAGRLVRQLGEQGSVAAPGFMKPEGIVIFHVASGQLFKKTLDKDDEPKSKAA